MKAFEMAGSTRQVGVGRGSFSANMMGVPDNYEDPIQLKPWKNTSFDKAIDDLMKNESRDANNFFDLAAEIDLADNHYFILQLLVSLGKPILRIVRDAKRHSDILLELERLQ